MPDLFATLAEERAHMRQALIDAALAVIVTERCIGRDDKAAAAIRGLEDELELRARDLVDAVDESPLNTWPRGWKITPDVKP